MNLCKWLRYYLYITITLLFLLFDFSNTLANPNFPKPQPHNFLYDYEKLISQQDVIKIKNLQRTAFQKHKVPIVVVSISRMSDFPNLQPPIESFAKGWFNQWGIGNKNENKGILFIFSHEDRKIRIELGEDWGRKWDEHCQLIMDDYIVPNFKSKIYSKGFLLGVEKLSRMAELGPNGNPPAPNLFYHLLNNPLNYDNPLPPKLSFMLLVCGVSLLPFAYFSKDKNRAYLLIGSFCMITSVFCWYIFFILIILVGMAFSDERIGGGYGGGGFGGGFGGGGSGGGGASGGC